jgi:hypothetical protein
MEKEDEEEEPMEVWFPFGIQTSAFGRRGTRPLVCECTRTEIIYILTSPIVRGFPASWRDSAGKRKIWRRLVSRAGHRVLNCKPNRESHVEIFGLPDWVERHAAPHGLVLVFYILLPHVSCTVGHGV